MLGVRLRFGSAMFFGTAELGMRRKVAQVLGFGGGLPCAFHASTIQLVMSSEAETSAFLTRLRDMTEKQIPWLRSV